jgi:hypothetical protein
VKRQRDNHDIGDIIRKHAIKQESSNMRHINVLFRFPPLDEVACGFVGYKMRQRQERLEYIIYFAESMTVFEMNTLKIVASFQLFYLRNGMIVLGFEEGILG